MLRIDLMIFDLDGTLIDSKRDIATCVNKMLGQMNHPKRDPEEIYSFIGLGVEKLIEMSLGTQDEAEIKKGLVILRPLVRKHLLDTTKLFQNTKETLEYFKDKRKVIISNRDKEFTSVLLRHLGIESYFEIALGGDEVGCRKPSPCPIEKVLSDIHIPKERAIITGDMAYDIISGKEAGVHTCAVTYGIGGPEDLKAAEPDFMIDDIIELKRIIF